MGLARILQDDVLSMRREVGTFAWAAPEVLLGQRVTEAADIYSVRQTCMKHLLVPVDYSLGRAVMDVHKDSVPLG